MNCLPRINNLYILLFGFLIPSAAFAQNGMYFDSDHTFLVPMMADDVLKGHAYIYKLDNVSKDSDSYMMQVFDEHLHDVGEKKIMMPSKATYHAALFNGTDLVVRFNIGKSGVRYLIFNQRAEQIFDTTLNIELRKASKWKETDFQQTPLISVAGQSVLDYVLSSHGGTTLVSVGNDHKVWTHEFRSSQPLQVNFLAANEKYILQSVYHFRKGKYGNDVGTSISFLSSQGVSIAETPVYRNDSVSFYPVAADLGTNGIEVISEFTRRAHEFSKVKYGVSLLHFDLNGKFLDEKANDFTVNLVNDSVFKKYKLLVHSYLYMHKATRLKNGNWLLAAEQFQKTRMKSGLGRNKNIIYNKKNICLMEINDEADIVQIHVEPNKPDGARVPRAYYRKPQNGSMVANNTGKLDFSYFIRSESDQDEKVSFIFTDGNYVTQKLSLGNMLFQNGKITVDRFVIPTFSHMTRIAILPARFGHALLIKWDPYLGLFDFDNIKFNN